MKSTRCGGALAALAAASLVLTGCAANEAAGNPSAGATAGGALSGTLTGVGSSAQAVAQTTWASLFQDAHPGVTVDYDPQGSGAGRSSFVSGAADFAGSDVPLSSDELSGTFASCAPGSDALDLPVYISPIALAYHLRGVPVLRLDAAVTAKIFSGKITKWNDPALVALNPGAKLPGSRITVVHRSDDSGTTQNFTEYLASQAPTVWTKPASQTFPYKVGDAAKGTSGVADTLKSAEGSIGYLDESGASGLATARLRVGDRYASISADGAASVVGASPIAKGREKGDLAIAIDRGDTAAGAWPLVLVSYLITCRHYKNADTAALVKAYANEAASASAQRAAAEQAGSAPLSADLAQKVKAAVAGIK